MTKNELIKKFMTKDLLDYLIAEEIIVDNFYLIEDVFLAPYEDTEKVIFHLYATVNYVDYLVEKVITNQGTSLTLNIFEVNEDNEEIEFELMTSKLTNV